MSLKLAPFVVAALAAFAGVAGCAVSETRYPLPVTPAEAPSTFGPIGQCATSQGYKSQVSTTNDSIQVFQTGGATIVYRIEDGKFFEEISILSTNDFSEADRQKKIQEAKPVADQIWACADAIRKGGAPPAPAATTAAPAATTAAPVGGTTAAPQ
jgi:hypothetical protein